MRALSFNSLRTTMDLLWAQLSGLFSILLLLIILNKFSGGWLFIIKIINRPTKYITLSITLIMRVVFVIYFFIHYLLLGLVKLYNSNQSDESNDSNNSSGSRAYFGRPGGSGQLNSTDYRGSRPRSKKCALDPADIE